MDSPANAIAGLIGLVVLFFVGRILLHVLRNQLARLHAIRSIPLPRQPALVSGKPSTQFEAVFLDVYDTEHWRSIGEPNHAQDSAEQIAEKRVFLFEHALCRREPRILCEIELGVPILRKLEDRDPQVCAWAEERLKANPPLFGEPDTIDNLILRPQRFRRFFWTHCIGSSPVLFFEQIFRSLPITVLPRALLPAGNRAEGGAGQSPAANTLSAATTREDEQRTKELIASTTESVLKKLETGDDTEARAAIVHAREAILKESADPRPASVREFLDRLTVYEERLATFEDAFATETSKHMDDWAPWLREALTDANGGASLADLGEDAVLDVFKRRARYRWVTDSSATAHSGSDPEGDEQEDERGPASASDETDKRPIIDTTGEVTDDAPASPARSSENNNDKGTEIGF